MPGASSMAWLRRFGACGLAHVQGPPVGAAEGSGDALLSFKDPAKCGPTPPLAVLAQAKLLASLPTRTDGPQPQDRNAGDDRREGCAPHYKPGMRLRERVDQGLETSDPDVFADGR